MRDQAEADAAIAALNDADVNGIRLQVKQAERDSRLVSETIPTGNRNSPLAWDAFLSSPFLPNAIRRKWMSVFDIEEVEDKADRRTFLRKEDASVGRKYKRKWDRFWAGRGGEHLSRPIDHIQRWNEAGRYLAELMSNVYHEARNRGGEGFENVMNVYQSLRLNPAISETLKAGSNRTHLFKPDGVLADVGEERTRDHRMERYGKRS